LKKTSLGPLRQGQRLDTSETKTMLKQRAPTTKAHKSSPCTEASSPWSSANSGHKPVRPVPITGQAGSTKTGQTGFHNRSGRFHTADHTPKAKNAKEMHKLPLDTWDRFQGYKATFLHLPFSPLLPMHESRHKCNLELLKYTKFITRCYTCPNEQVRYSTGLYGPQLHDHQVSQPLDKANKDLSNFAKSYSLTRKNLDMSKTCQNGKATQTSC
jgi:hypothetical protein